MKLAIVGSRTFDNKLLEIEYIHLLKTAYETLFGEKIEVISGGAKGADSLAEKAALVSEIPVKVYKPDWNKYGKSAGYIRNQQIIDVCDMVLAFWDGKSKGTKDTIQKAKKAKKPTFIVYF
jgi:hypothetical protein